MNKVSKTEGVFNFEALRNAVNERLKEELKNFGLTYQITADLIEMKLPTFQDKIGGRTPWTIEEFAKLCIYLNKTSDELIFGNALFVTQWNIFKQVELKDKLKDILTAKKNYKLLGKLTAEGFFD